jgi:hypothetical protein
MKNVKSQRLLRIGLLVFLLCLFGAVLMGGAEGNAAPGTASGDASDRMEANQQSCYTIDTSRPEWLGNWTTIYLPIITKSYSP